MNFSGQKQIRFHHIYQLRSGILFAFAQKNPTLWVKTITVFDTDRGMLLIVIITAERPTLPTILKFMKIFLFLFSLV